MKKTIFSTMIASLLIFVGCQNEELVNESTDNSNGKKVTLTAHIAGSADSRVTLEEQIVEGKTKIMVDWRKDAKYPETFTVYNKSFDNFDFTQDFELDANGNTFSCDTELSGDFNNSHAYYGYQLIYKEDKWTLSYDLSNQDGTLKEDYVLMQAPFNENSTSLTFEHKTAIVKFTFNGISTGAEIDEIVMEGVTTLSEGNQIVVEPEDQNNIYVFIPTEYNGKDGVADYDNGDTFNFTVTDSNDKIYTGSLTISKAIEAGRRYTATVALSRPEPVPVDLPIGDNFKTVVKKALSENFGTQAIRFVPRRNKAEMDAASFFLSDNNMPDNVKYNVVDDPDTSLKTLEIITDADIFNFNALCSSMFASLTNITSIDFNGCVNTANVTNMASMFQNSSSLTSLDLSSFNTEKVTTMQYMFKDCGNLTSLNLSSFNTSNVTDMQEMFYNCKVLETLDLGSFNTSIVTDMQYMFKDCKKLTSLDLSSFNTSNVTNMQYMFNYCSSLTSLILSSSFNTEKVTNMQYMFNYCEKLSSLNLSSFNTSIVTDMQYMFKDCKKLTSLDLSSFDTSNVTNMRYMFSNCSSLTSLILSSSFNTENVTDMQEMFYNCSSLTSLNLSSFRPSKVTTMVKMFYGCGALSTLDLGTTFFTTNVKNMSEMFSGVTKLTHDLNLKKFSFNNISGSGAYKLLNGFSFGDNNLKVLVSSDGYNYLNSNMNSSYRYLLKVAY